MKQYKIDKNTTVDISDEVFSAIRYMSYKERRAAMKDAEQEIIHYYAFDAEENDGENLIKDTRPLPDEIVITDDICNALYNALANLSVEDQLLLFNLYVEEESMRSIATREHSNAMYISRHRKKILKKLAKILTKYKVE